VFHFFLPPVNSFVESPQTHNLDPPAQIPRDPFGETDADLLGGSGPGGIFGNPYGSRKAAQLQPMIDETEPSIEEGAVRPGRVGRKRARSLPPSSMHARGGRAGTGANPAPWVLFFLLLFVYSMHTRVFFSFFFFFFSCKSQLNPILFPLFFFQSPRRIDAADHARGCADRILGVVIVVVVIIIIVVVVIAVVTVVGRFDQRHGAVFGSRWVRGASLRNM
jgi:hypothetical protein